MLIRYVAIYKHHPSFGTLRHGDEECVLWIIVIVPLDLLASMTFHHCVSSQQA